MLSNSPNWNFFWVLQSGEKHLFKHAIVWFFIVFKRVGVFHNREKACCFAEADVAWAKPGLSLENIGVDLFNFSQLLVLPRKEASQQIKEQVAELDYVVSP